MSLVSTYVQADDGKWYQNPVLKGKGWFLCYDDDEPIEIVIQAESKIPRKLDDLLGELRKAGYELVPMSGRPMRSGRVFGEGIDAIKQADAYFLRHVRGAMPAAYVAKHDGITDKLPNRSCVFYPVKPG